MGNHNTTLQVDVYDFRIVFLVYVVSVVFDIEERKYV
jgi:hypothetical protein